MKIALKLIHLAHDIEFIAVAPFEHHAISYSKSLVVMESQGLFCCRILDRPSLTVRGLLGWYKK